MSETEILQDHSSNLISSPPLNDLLNQTKSNSTCSIAATIKPAASTVTATKAGGNGGGGGGEKRKRLSLLGNVHLPSVHGCLTSSKNAGNSNNNNKTNRTRLSTHQRNLSLDFR